MPAAERASASDKYRKERRACDRELTVTLAQLSASIADPVAKLRYLRSAIDAHRHERIVRHVPGAPVRLALYRWHGLAALTRKCREAAAAPTPSLLTRARAQFGRKSALAAAALAVPV